MANYNAEIIVPPGVIEAAKDPRAAEIMNAPVASKPSVSVGQSVGPVRRSVG